MEGIAQPGADSAKLPVAYREGSTLFSQRTVVLSQQEHIQLKWEARYWKSHHARALEREAALKKALEQSEAQVRDLKQRLYGKKSEKGVARRDGPQTKAGSSRPRGQQAGRPGHGRTPRPDLPVFEEVRELRGEERCCSSCGAPLESFPGTEDSEIIEIQVQGYLRRIKRQRYKKTCRCPETPGLITAPPAPRLIPRSPSGVSVWIEVLLDKYLYCTPTNRLCTDFAALGLPIAQGTLTGGLRKLGVLFEPLAAAMYEKQMTERRFHADETRWMVFEAIEGKVGYRWYLWITQSASVVYYRVAPGRGANVPKAHFAGLSAATEQAILVCDRYIAYKCLAEKNAVIVLAFCWAHVRRDFLEAARSWPALEAWMLSWVEAIGELYRLNGQRLALWEERRPLAEQSTAFTARHEALLEKLSEMAERREGALQEETLHSAQRKVLESLKNHWPGLTVFVEHPEVPMDNNAAERSARNPVTGRKNYYGSGRVWSAQLAAMMFTVFQSVLLWGLNPRHWLHSFLCACAEKGGTVPADLSPFLPWAMDEARREALSRPVPGADYPAPLRAKVLEAPEIMNTS